MIEFTAVGRAVPQGSKKFVGTTPSGRPLMRESSPDHRSWRTQVTEAALATDVRKMSGPIKVEMRFMVRRPKSHFGTGKNAEVLKASAPHWVVSMPDLDKLVRAILDAMTDAGCWGDDCEVAALEARKVYARHGELPGVHVRAWEI